jgi:trimethyllysine dioxygenase
LGDRADSAYSNVALKAHHDCTYLKNAPGFVKNLKKKKFILMFLFFSSLEIFQLIKHNGNGGNTLLVDSFYCAQKLKELYPEDFEVLTKINVKAFFNENDKYSMSHIDPVIKLNPIDGSLMQIRQFKFFFQKILKHFFKDF